MKARTSRLVLCVTYLALATVPFASADPVAVRVVEGPARDVLVLRSLNENVLANGERVQTVSGDRVTSQVVFRFSDGSLHEETAVFTQNQVFRLVTYHLVQTGPSFRWTLDMTMDAQTGHVVIRHQEKGGNEEVEDEKLDLAADVANGMMVAVLKNLSSATVPAAASFVAATPEPRRVKLAITAAGSESVSIGGSNGRATHYVVKAKIGGIAGILAPLAGKQPPDTHVWILDGPAPAFVKSEGPLFYGGPIWRIERANPEGP